MSTLSKTTGLVQRSRTGEEKAARSRCGGRTRICRAVALLAIALLSADLRRVAAQEASDGVRARQFAAMEAGVADWGHWGGRPDIYSHWTKHSNRLIPVYVFGATLEGFTGEGSVYRHADRLRDLYGYLPEETLHPQADYMDQTDIWRLQRRAVQAGKRYLFLVVFDGMDWQTSHAAATYRLGADAFSSGRGRGLHFLDNQASIMDFGSMVTSPAADRCRLDVDAQTAVSDDDRRGGYDASLGGKTPWADRVVHDYLLGTYRRRLHVVTDSASSATSMTSGIKTYNAAINVDCQGRQIVPLARQLQADSGFAVGVVTSVPLSHATPAAAYANNVSRDDYQDLTRDLIGRPSVAHREQPLPGVDVLLGAGWGDDKESEERQGRNYEPGNRHLSATDERAVACDHGGSYVVVKRTAGAAGAELLHAAAERAVREKRRLLGMFGVPTGHLPYQTADGGYNPTRGASRAEQYTPADLAENPTLADLTRAALRVLESRRAPIWLMVEAGDVDWANHENNIDDSIGAVLSGDAAVRVITDWIDARDAWDETMLIVTADHGHYFHLVDASALIEPRPAQ